MASTISSTLNPLPVPRLNTLLFTLQIQVLARIALNCDEVTVLPVFAEAFSRFGSVHVAQSRHVALIADRYTSKCC